MKKFSLRMVYLCVLAASTLFVRDAIADSLLHPLFSSNAVLQRDRQIPVWGDAPANTRVEILLDNQKTTTIADASGRWMAKIGPRRASLGHRLVVSTATQKEVCENIAFGDVWICSGQSNMEWRLFWGAPKPVDNAELEAKNANFPAIRLFTVPRVSSLTPKKTVVADWKVCTPETVKDISAVGYFFGREIHQKTGVPIGLIDASWGGTAAEVWTSAEALDAISEFKGLTAGVKNTQADVPYAVQYEQYVKSADRKTTAADVGLKSGWFLPDFDDAAWKTMQLPTYWDGIGDEELKDFDGIVWFRREVTLDEVTAKSGDLTLKLGPIDDGDSVYWNGEKIGEGIGWDKPRSYIIPASKLRVGKNSVVLRVLDSNGGGGFGGKAEDLKLVSTDGKSIPLSGSWKYKPSMKLSGLPAPPVNIVAHTTAPTILFNGMISPLLPYGIKGAIWYQGEANAGNPKQYENLLPALIADWRARFGSGNFPFYIVQLAAFMQRDTFAGQSIERWPVFRESQEKIAKKVKNSGIAVTTDIGDEADIHPRNKQDVGRRLAALALKNDYKQNVSATGPTLKSVRRVNNTLVLELANTGGALKTKGDITKAFIIAGADKKWAWAQTVSIQNKKNSAQIVLTAPEVAAPVAVRFGWANFPLGHLYNQAGLPAAPFRSDSW